MKHQSVNPIPCAVHALVAGLLLVGCASGTATDSTEGKAFFEDQSYCTHGPVEQEKNKEYYLRRLAWMKMMPAPAANSRIILTGESTAALFTQDLLKQHLPKYNITNRAIPGETTIAFMSALDELVLKHRPTTVIVAIGGNDLLGGRCLSTIQKNTEAILNRIHTKLPGAKVLLVSIPPVVSKDVSTAAVQLNERFKHLAGQMEYVEYVDLWPYLANQEEMILAEDYHIYMDDKGKVDQIHFNAKGYSQFAEALRRHLRN